MYSSLNSLYEFMYVLVTCSVAYYFCFLKGILTVVNLVSYCSGRHISTLTSKKKKQANTLCSTYYFLAIHNEACSFIIDVLWNRSSNARLFAGNASLRGLTIDWIEFRTFSYLVCGSESSATLSAPHYIWCKKMFGWDAEVEEVLSCWNRCLFLLLVILRRKQKV